MGNIRIGGNLSVVSRAGRNCKFAWPVPASGMSKAPKPSVDLSARCACGAVAVRVHGPIFAMLMCSCLDCQKATGTGHATVALAAPSDVTITGPVSSFERPADSGALFTRSFCPHCGTPIAGRSSRAPDAIMLPVGLFGADTGWFAPNQLIFARTHHQWDTIAPDLPRYVRYRDSGEI